MALGHLGLLVYWVFNYISGYPLYRMVFRKSITLERFVIPQIIGLFFLPLLFTLSYFVVGFDASLYTTPAIATLAAVASLKAPQEISKEKLSSHAQLIAVLLAFLIPVSYSFISGSIFTASADSTFYQTATNHIKDFRTLPPEMGCLPGEVYHYPWFFNLAIALQQILTGLSIIDVHPFYAIYASAIFLLSTFLFGSQHSGKSLGLVYTAFVCLYLYGSMLAASPTVYVFPLIILFLLCLSRYVESNDKKTGVLCGIAAGSTMYIHGLSFGFVSLVFLAYALRKSLEFDKESFKSIVYPILGFTISIPYALFIGGKAISAFVFLPFGGITIFNLLGSMGIIFLVFSLLSLKSKLTEARKIFFYAILLIFIFTNVFVMKQSSNIDRYMTYAVFITGLLSLDFLSALEKKKQYAIVIAFLLLFAPHALGISMEHASRTPTSQTQEYAISIWIKENTKKEDIIAAAPTPVYAGLSERRQLICEPFFLIPWLYDGGKVKGRFSDFLSIYSSPTQSLVEKYNIRYFVFGDREKEYLKSYSVAAFDFSKSQAFRQVFAIKGSGVYELANISALPPSAAYPAFEKYSRWWTVIG